MRILIGILLFSTIVSVSVGQEPPPVLLKSNVKVQVHRLAIESSRLPDGDRDRIAHLFENADWFQEELQERILQAFRDLGYFKAVVDVPKVSVTGQTEGTEDVDVSVRVEEGIQYRLGGIRFEKGLLFPTDQLRAQFSMRTGDVFSPTLVSKGLDQVRELYATKGYINCVLNPVLITDESRRTIDLDMQLDWGEPYDFGRLFLDGTEPHRGAYKALMESWKTLQGKRYDPSLLKGWLEANASRWPGVTDPERIETKQTPGTHVVDIRLRLQ